MHDMRQQPGLASHFVEVEGSPMHYVEVGSGDPVLFLHGNPTSSYLWRNILPRVSDQGRCIALDLIGMGRSDKPDIEYRFVDHARYVEGFIETLGLANLTLVIHDWGAGLGLDYACHHPSNIRAIALMEGIYRPVSWKEQPLFLRWMFRRLRHPVKGRRMIVEKNFFVEKMLPMMIVRKLTAEEMAQYREPFLEPKSRRPVQVWPREIPFDGDPPDVHARIAEASRWLRGSTIPKLLLWVKPGVIIKKRDVEWWRREVPNLEDIYLGKGKHFLQEDHPGAIGDAIAKWLARVSSPVS